jgi:hypothetical protein
MKRFKRSRLCGHGSQSGCAPQLQPSTSIPDVAHAAVLSAIRRRSPAGTAGKMLFANACSARDALAARRAELASRGKRSWPRSSRRHCRPTRCARSRRRMVSLFARRARSRRRSRKRAFRRRPSFRRRRSRRRSLPTTFARLSTEAIARRALNASPRSMRLCESRQQSARPRRRHDHARHHGRGRRAPRFSRRSPNGRRRSRVSIGQVTITRDAGDTLRQAVESAIILRARPDAFAANAPERDMARPWRGMRLMEMGRAFLAEAHGMQLRGLGVRELAGTLLGMDTMNTRAAGYGSTSDFANVLANVIDKRLRNAYALAPQNWKTARPPVATIPTLSKSRSRNSRRRRCVQTGERGSKNLATAG